MAIILVEPNNININNNIVNGIPQYQDMFIFAELIATSKGRSVITNSTVVSDNGKKINMLGVNQDNSPNNPDYLKFTTNYYDGSMDNKDVLESFGITNIKVTVNSSYVPQVTIQFVDIRGLSFFNTKNSPYRVLFDFPPPIFELTIKGYYGKALTYKLHLVKYTTEFQAENGNFIINADFVAMTFAPLSDILFRYIVNVPLITNGASMNPESKEAPKTTYELILKLKNLYSDIEKKFKSQPVSQSYDAALNKLTSITNTIKMLSEYKGNQELISRGKPYLIVKLVEPVSPFVKQIPTTQSNQNSDYQKIETLNQFDDMLKKQSTSGTVNNSNMRLCIGYVAGTNIQPADTNDNPILNPISQYTGDNGRITELKNVLNTYRNNIISTTPSSISNKNIPDANDEYGKYNVESGTYISTRYVMLDITDYYTELYKTNIDLNKQKNEFALDINNKINEIVMNDLGMMPTVYNIFKIILDDVDTFFKILGKTSNAAEISHNEISNKTIISSNNSNDVKGITIYSFPLIIRESNIAGGIKQERIAPIELQKQGIDFPELTLVQNFIDSFQTQKNIQSQLNMRTEQNDDGTYKWIPVSPFDSILGGASPASPYIGTEYTLERIYQTLLRRYYILSQGTIPNVFENDNNVTKEYINLYATSEAANLAASLGAQLNPEFSDLVKTSATNYGKSNGLVSFHNYISKISENGINLYDLNNVNNGVKEFPITPTDNTNGLVYVDKNNIGFEGINLYPEPINLREKTETENATNPIDKFTANVEGPWYKTFFIGSPREFWYDFTQENVLYVKDVKDDDGKFTENNVVLKTRYLGNMNSAALNNENNVENNIFTDFNKSLTTGNKFGNKTHTYASNNLKNATNIVELWRDYLSYSTTQGKTVDTLIYNDVINYNLYPNNGRLSALILLSNFGYALGPFNLYPNGLNELVFTTPAAIEVPTYLPLYIGAIVDAIEGDDSTSPWINTITNFYVNGVGQYLPNGGNFIAADIHDIQTYLSVNDRAKFKEAFLNYYNDSLGFPTLLKEINNLYNEVHNGTYKNLNVGYDILLNPKSENTTTSAKGIYFSDLLSPLITRKNITVFSQLTFEMKTTYNSGYTSLKARQNNELYKKWDDNFFSLFFVKLNEEILGINKKIKEEKDKNDKIKGDIDVITQTYYSFKNINDKWLTSPTETISGYPYNDTGKNLIDSFAFVDRAMNPIGDTMINAELLPQLFEDTNVSIFSVLSQLLSANGFEFFPLQNFMSFDSNGWENSFKIITNIPQNNNASAFVCMYIGGSSSYPSTSSSETNGFVNDGIIDLSVPQVPDFNTTSSDTKQEQETNNLKFPFRQVRAFRVRFGEQNQSMFTDIKIDSKEYTDTNESINILARLAGDNKISAPTPKGQNLYNMYENRSYKATVTSMGNAMIQPTQYFQIENVPLFNGAYIILNVEHNITPNKMMTTFSGTKILQYPSPRVLSPVAFVGIDEDISNLSAGQIVQGALLTNYPQTQYNSMYTFKIS